MDDKEIEKVLLDTMRITKENREYLIKIDRRQRWSINWKVFYWSIIVILAVTGYYFAFPYLQTVRDQFKGFSDQVGSLVGMVKSE